MNRPRSHNNAFDELILQGVHLCLLEIYFSHFHANKLHTLITPNWVENSLHLGKDEEIKIFFNFLLKTCIKAREIVVIFFLCT